MIVYRLAKTKYIRDLSGTGARLYGGRWNHKGTSVLYTSEHSSLALLELLVHTPHTLLPPSMSLLKLEVPDGVSMSTYPTHNLPRNWRQYPAPDVLAEIGTLWANNEESVAMRAPSVLVPDEWNMLLNPSHPEFEEISIESVSHFRIDSRF